MLVIDDIKRVFTIESKNITLDDPNPEMSPERVMVFYSDLYPELTTCTVTEGEYENDQLVYKFVQVIGTKA